MYNKKIFIIIVFVAIGAIWFFGKSNKIETSINMKKPEVDYQATEIRASQTNDQGTMEYEVIAESLLHNSTTEQDELIDSTMNWYPTTDKHYQLIAGKTVINQQTGELLMTNGFKLISQHNDRQHGDVKHQKNQLNNGNQPDSTPNTLVKTAEPVIITGDNLVGNTKLKQIYSNSPITFQQGENTFTARSMTANLTMGDYEFVGVEISFQPAERQDKPLF